MKKRISVSVFISFLLLLVVVPPVFAALRAEPLVLSQFDYRGKYQTDLFTGGATYSYPIKVPKGTDELTPEISFTYNSAGVRSNSYRVGIGWQLSQDYIERDVNFTPASTSDDKFKLYFKGSVYDLVYVSSEGRYHTKTESNLNITKLTAGASNDHGEYWQVTTTDGTKYRFGQASNSELVCNGRSYVSMWNLDQVTDIHDNKIYYTYTENSGVSYLTQIKYNNDQQRVLDFTYANSPYQKQVYVQGCNVTETSRLSNIQVKLNTSLITQYDIAYASAGNSQSVLQSITEKGSDGSALSPTTFEYKPEVKSWATSSASWIDNGDLDYLTLDRPDIALSDINGDGYTDIVKTDYHGGPSVSWKALLNQGTGWSTQYQYWIDNDPLEEARLDRQDVRLMDVTGDGLPDIVKASGSGSWYVWRNNGTSFSSSYENWVDLGSYGSNLHLNNASVTLVDVTGDGLPDIVNNWWNGQSEWRVWRNTGSSWNSTAEIWSQGSPAHGIDAADSRLLDVNGDGLTDIVNTSYNGNNETSSDTWKVYKNTGSSWNSTPETWINNAPINAHIESTYTAIVDVNGDGLPDIVRTDDLGAGDKWKALLNQGNSWSTTYETWIDPSSNVDIDVHNNDTKLVEVNGDGLPDIVRGYTSGGQGRVTWKVWKNNGNAPDLLGKVITNQGGSINFEYKKSTDFSNVGGDSLSDLPFPLWVVSKKTENNGMTTAHQTNDVTTYTYKDGMYKWQDREFRGFAEINTTEPNGSKKKYVFNQDDALKGTLAEVQHRDSSNNPYAETENTWSNTLANGIYTVNLTSEKQYSYDGTATDPKIIQTDYQYDNYGNITKKSELGDTSITSDNRFAYDEFTYNTTAWIVNTVKHSYINKDNDTTKIRESWFYYDSHTGLNDAPTKGDVTMEQKWLDTQGSTNPVTTYGYDSYGNQTLMVDANNHTTTTVYDTATHTYPISITNAKNQTTTMNYELGTGNLLSKTDPNGFTTSYEYDVFGRITKEIKPYDSSSYPTTSYAYLIDGIAPEGTVVSKREVSSSSASLNVFTFVDGFGRKIQTRSDAEDTTKQKVVDTLYDATGEIAKETVPYLNASSAVTPPPNPTPPPATKFGDGSDGNITISSNTTEAPIDSSVTATSGTTTATVGAGSGFATNQIVLFHQTQGTNAGTWELRRVQSYSGTTLTLTTALTNSYNSSGNNKAQVRVVPQYQNVTVNSGVTWSAKAWNGTKGGILAFLANGTVTNNGTISATGKGFLGGSGGVGATPRAGLQGESATGVGSRNTSANGMGGGGGGVGTPTNSDAGGGGGGGGYAASGSNGTNDNQSPIGVGGTGGNSGGVAALTTLFMGGGGGGGGSDDSAGPAGVGGNGGGIIFISGATISVAGSVASNASNGTSGNADSGGGGGGGAGGSVLFYTQNATLGTNLLTVGAGSGATGRSAFGGVGGNGGSGAVGRIRVEYETSLSGSTTPTASSAQTTISLLPAGVLSIAPPTGTYVTPDASAKYTQMTYDAIGRPTIITNPKGDSKTISYDHWKETTIDENGHIKREYKNAFDKIIKVDEVLNSVTIATTYTYDAADNLTKITDAPGNETTFVYDTLGRKTSQTDPDMGTWQYEYDGVGNLKKQTDNRNIVITKTYDELDRLTKIDYPTETDVLYTYDGNSKIGTLTSVTDAAGTLNFSYDNRLRKTQETRVIDGNTWTTQYAYDALDRVLSKTNPDSEVVSNTYNEQGEVDSVSGASSLLTNIDYNALGKITKKEFANGLTTNYTYNTDDFRLSRIQTGSLQDLNYTYDNVGNVGGITDALLSKTQLFSYDDLDRLKTASESGVYNFAYTYNSIGNLTKFTNAGVDINYLYGENNKPHALTSSTETGSGSSYTFLKGVNFNGNAVTIEGNAWQSMSTALSNGLSVPSGYNSATTSLTPNPSVNSDTNAMLNSAIWRSNAPLTINQTLSNGNYQIYLWVMENYQNYVRKMNVKLEGTQVATDIGHLPKNDWVKYGPYNVTVNDGTLNTELVNAVDSPHVMGMAIYEQSGATPTPTPTATPTPTPTPSSGYNGQYFNNTNLSGTPVLTRTDQTVNFNWGSSSPDPAVNTDNFSARWTKTENFAAGTYQFSVTADDGVRLYIDNNLVIDKWILQGPTTYTTTQTLSAGNHTIKMEYFESGGGAVAQLSYQEVTATPTPTFTPTPTPSGDWTFCANENGTCSFSGTKEVRYGANNSYFYREATTSIACNNATFGDPISGTAKQCHYRDTTAGTEILGTTWTLSGNNGADEEDKVIAANTLNGKTRVAITFNLQGNTFGGGDDEASVVFVQNGDWRAANLTRNGGQNSLNGSQTVIIPINKFYKVGNSSIVLDPNQDVSNLHSRFWKNSAFTLTITSIRVQ